MSTEGSFFRGTINGPVSVVLEPKAWQADLPKPADVESHQRYGGQWLAVTTDNEISVHVLVVRDGKVCVAAWGVSRGRGGVAAGDTLAGHLQREENRHLNGARWCPVGVAN